MSSNAGRGSLRGNDMLWEAGPAGQQSRMLPSVGNRGGGDRTMHSKTFTSARKRAQNPKQRSRTPHQTEPRKTTRTIKRSNSLLQINHYKGTDFEARWESSSPQPARRSPILSSKSKSTDRPRGSLNTRAPPSLHNRRPYLPNRKPRSVIPWRQNSKSRVIRGNVLARSRSSKDHSLRGKHLGAMRSESATNLLTITQPRTSSDKKNIVKHSTPPSHPYRTIKNPKGMLRGRSLGSGGAISNSDEIGEQVAELYTRLFLTLDSLWSGAAVPTRKPSRLRIPLVPSPEWKRLMEERELNDREIGNSRMANAMWSNPMRSPVGSSKRGSPMESRTRSPTGSMSEDDELSPQPDEMVE